MTSDLMVFQQALKKAPVNHLGRRDDQPGIQSADIGHEEQFWPEWDDQPGIQPAEIGHEEQYDQHLQHNSDPNLQDQVNIGGQNVNHILGPVIDLNQNPRQHVPGEFLEISDLIAGAHELNQEEFQKLEEMLNPVIHNHPPIQPILHEVQANDLDLNVPVVEMAISDLTVTFSSDSGLKRTLLVIPSMHSR